jgi:hypothetical protein
MLFALALLVLRLGAGVADDSPRLDVTSVLVDGSDATVEITTRNASEHGVDARVHATLWLTAHPRGEKSSRPPRLLTAVDPTDGSSEGLFETPAADLELPARASRSVEVDLTQLQWSLSPKDVEAPRALWELDAWGEYDLQIVLDSVSRDDLETGLTKSLLIRVRLPRGPDR